MKVVGKYIKYEKDGIAIKHVEDHSIDIEEGQTVRFVDNSLLEHCFENPTEENKSAAKLAAKSAAWSAAWSAAKSAAKSAAWSAAKDSQEQQLLTILKESFK